MERLVSKSKFKPRSLEYFRQIEEGGGPIIITDHGHPVLKVVRYEAKPFEVLPMLRNSVKRLDEPTEPVGEKDWEAVL